MSQLAKLLGIDPASIPTSWPCEYCGATHPLFNKGQARCEHGCCVNFFCDLCRSINGGFGPAGCECGCDELAVASR